MARLANGLTIAQASRGGQQRGVEDLVTTAESERLLKEGIAAQQRGDASGAMRLFEGVLALDGVNPYALNAIGMRALESKDFTKAESYFTRAAKADGKEAALWLNVASAQRAQGNDSAERASLESALALDQRNFMALLRKAELHERLAEAGSAAQAWKGLTVLANQAGDLPPALAERIAHGQEYVESHLRELGSQLDVALIPARDGLSGAELRRFDACVDMMLGKRRTYRNECHGVYFPFLPADEYFDKAHFPWMAELEAQTDVIRAELRALVAQGHEGFRPYVSQESGTPENKWTPLDKSLDWSALFLWEYGVRNDEICGLCPGTAAALERLPRSDIPGRAPTAFFSLLKPRSHIPPHTGVTNLRAIIHLPLIVPEGCRFRVGGETRAWREGEAFAFDDTIDHEAWNDSDELRAVLIFDAWNPHLSETEHRLVRTLFEASDASGLNPARDGGAPA
jgi:aspartyl/asparaginyl beta-hydroxylase (cupin superfamily)